MFKTNKLRFNKKRTILLISILLIIIGVIPLIVLIFYAAPENPYIIKQKTFISEDGTEIKALIYLPEDVSDESIGIVVAHGFCGNKQYMQPLSIELVKRGFVVVSIDFRGHGSSDGYLPPLFRETDSHELEEDMLAAVDFLKSMGIHKIGLVGHSMGGRTAQNVAENNPKLIDATVSIGMISLGKNFTLISNLLIAIGKYEQIFSEDMALEFLQEYTGKKNVEIGKQYGDFEKGDATKVVIGKNSEHLAEVFDYTIIFETVQWFELAFNGEEADDIQLTVQYYQLFFIISLVGVVLLIFIIAIYSCNRLWPTGLQYPEKTIIENISLMKLISIYILGAFIGAIFLFPLSIIFTSVLPVSMGHMLYAFMVGTAIGVIIVYYFFIIRPNDNLRIKDFSQKIKDICSTTPKSSIFFSIAIAIISITLLASIMHWSTTATFPTAREIGAIVGMTILFFPFLLIKEFYFRNIQGCLETSNRIEEFFKMVSIGILIDNLLLIPLLIITWQSSNFTLAFIALSLTVVLIFSIIQQILVTWIYMHSGRNILGSTIFLCIIYSWMIINFFPFGLN
ncbi:MAG: alpha/beta hydrolase family protein [Promethearchaeota archaeon]